MNSPPLRPEALSPTLSPIAFSLDDPNNHNSGFQHFLASPTKLKLDKGVGGTSSNNSGSSGGPSLIYRTSLSKLSELSRSGRSRQRSNSDTLRSSSPIRFQLFNNAPKMLKPEYMSQQAPLPLLSTLMKQSTTGMPSSTNQDSRVSQADSAARFSIRETLEKLQRDQWQAERQRNDVKEQRVGEPSSSSQNDPASSDNHIPFERKVSESKSAISGSTMCDKQSDPNETVKVIPTRPKAADEIRLISNSSLTSSTVSIDFNDLPKDLDLEALTTDKNGFAHVDDFKSNRCSFISSTSTDYDADWCNQQVTTHDETAKLDYRIKQLEVEISELKLQNEKLIHSITKSRTVEDIFMQDALNEIKSTKQEVQKGMERKVKQLEKKVENYRKAIKSRGDNALDDSSSKDKRNTYPMGENIQVSTLRKRIARISSLELRKIEEQGDSSSSSSDDEREVKLDKPEAVQDSMLTNQSRHQIDSNSMSARRKAGLQLNIHVEPLDDER